MFVFTTGINIGRARKEFSGLCSRWIGEGTATGERPAHQRFFEVLFAAPLFGMLCLAAGLASGLSVSAGLAALLTLMAVVFIAASIVAKGWRLELGLASLVGSIAALGAISASTAALGPALALPLVLVAATETHFIARQARLSILAAMAVFFSTLLGAALSGNTGAVFVPAALAICAALVHGATLLLRDWSVTAHVSGSEPVGTDSRLLDADGVIRAEMSLSGEVRRIAGDCAGTLGISAKRLEGFGLYERLLVADRLHYLSALDEIRTGKNTAVIHARLRHDGADSAYLPVRIVLCRADDQTVAVSIRAADNVHTPDRSTPAAKSPLLEGQIKADRYLASVSHELRTPLNAILGFSDILKQEMFGAMANDRQREYVELIHVSGSHLLSVVNMILDMSKIDMGAYHIIAEPFDVEDAAALSIAMVREQAAKKQIVIETNFDRQACECTGDRRAVQQILINLLSNAVKFTPDKGRITLTSENEAGCLVMRVADTGIGISPEDLELIGQPFFQVQNDYTRSFEGTGLGLSLVRGLVELHAGGLSIESEVGAGTSVTVRLPLKGPAAHSKRGALTRLNQQRANAELTGPAEQVSIAEGAGHEPAIRKTA